MVGADGSLLASQKESDRGAIVATSGSSMAGEARFAVGWQDSFAAVFTTAGQSGACSLQLTNGGSVCAAGALRGLEWASPVAALAALVVRTYGEEDGVVIVLNVVPVALGGSSLVAFDDECAVTVRPRASAHATTERLSFLPSCRLLLFASTDGDSVVVLKACHLSFTFLSSILFQVALLSLTSAS